MPHPTQVPDTPLTPAELTDAERAELTRQHPRPIHASGGYRWLELATTTRDAIAAAELLAEAESRLASVNNKNKTSSPAALEAHYLTYKAYQAAEELAGRLYLVELLARPDLYDGAAAIYRARGLSA